MIITGENISKQSLDKQLQLCDHFRRMCRLIHVDDLTLLMEEKRRLSEEFSSYAKTSSVSTYVQQRLEELLDEVTVQLENELQEKGGINDYTEKIHALLADQTLSEKVELPDGMIRLLSSAEYLYQQYLLDRDASSQMDYSFIATLYYKALENLLNNKFYIPFIKPLKDRKIDTKELSRYFDKNQQGLPYNVKNCLP